MILIKSKCLLIIVQFKEEQRENYNICIWVKSLSKLNNTIRHICVNKIQLYRQILICKWVYGLYKDNLKVLFCSVLFLLWHPCSKGQFSVLKIHECISAFSLSSPIVYARRLARRQSVTIHFNSVCKYIIRTICQVSARRSQCAWNREFIPDRTNFRS